MGNQTHLIGPIAQSLILADLVQMVYCVVLEKKKKTGDVCVRAPAGTYFLRGAWGVRGAYFD